MFTTRNADIVINSVTLLAFQLTFASAISSTAIMGQSMDLHVSEQVSQLAVWFTQIINTQTLFLTLHFLLIYQTAVFLFGFGLGGIPFGPLSEAVGRQSIYTSTLFVSTCFEIGAAFSNNIWTLIICKLLNFGSITKPRYLTC